MRKFDVAFQPKVYFQLTLEEVYALMDTAKCHYDWACRTTAIPGDGAFLYGASMSDGHFSVSSRELDILCKIVEMPPPSYEKIIKGLAPFLHFMFQKAKEITPDMKEGIEYGNQSNNV